MMDAQRFDSGDEVRHTKRPEWGRGVIRQVQAINHEGKPAQRLTIDFANRGRVVLNTAVASLTQGSIDPPMKTPAAESTNIGWLDAMEKSQGKGGKTLTDLPESLSDPFLSESRRLAMTLKTFSFSTQARSLMDWAVAQTGLDDPLSKYTRHELEEAFRRYAYLREQHLRELVRMMKRQGMQRDIEQCAREATEPSAREALARAMRA